MIEREATGKTLVWDIVVPPRRRRVTGEQVQDMRRSLREHGLITPIGIRIVDRMEVDGKEAVAVPVLVFGATRLEAAKQEGWREIATQVLTGSDIDFQKAEIIENLHRSELTVLERAEWTAALAGLCAREKAGQVDPVFRGGRGNEGGVREAAREIKKADETEEAARSRVRRAIEVAAIAPAAREAARAAKLDDNQSALLRVAAEPTPEAQVAKVQEIAERREQTHISRPRTEPSPDAIEFAAFLLERIPEADLLENYLRTVRVDDLLWALKRAKAA